MNRKGLFFLIVFFWCGLFSFAQQQKLPNYTTKIKASFISNFYKYVEWPESAIKDTFYIGILKDSEIANEIRNSTKNKSFGKKNIPFKVEELQNLDRADELNLLFANSTSGYQPERLFRAIGNNPVLLVTENYDYNTTMINFFTDQSKIRYQVNLSTTESKNLVVDNQILNTAFVGEEEDWQKQLMNLRLELNQEKDINQQKTQQIAKLNSAIKEKEAILKEKEAILEERAKELYDIQERIQIQKVRSNQLMGELEMNKEIIEAKQEAIENSDRRLKNQIKEIESAKTNLAEVQKSMNKTMALLNNQRLFTTAAIIIAIIIAILLFYAYRNYRKQKAQAIVISQQKEQAELQRDEIGKQHLQLEQKTKEITDSINYAKRIQEAMLPPLTYFNSNLPKSFVFYLPKDIVAGDFYWMESEDDLTIFAAADCTGHGVPGALVSVICGNALNRSVREYKLTEPAGILDKTLEIVLEKFERSDEDVKDGMDIALCTLNTKTGLLQFAGANNPLWVIRKGSNEIEEYKGNKQPIGSYLRHEPFKNQSLQLEEGDTAYIFSDGYVDQFGGKHGKKFKSLKLKSLLLSIYDKPMEEQQTIIKNNFYEWMGDYEQLDDICLIGFRK